MKVERDIRIDAPPQRVYDVVMDPRRLEDWVTIHDHLEDAPDGALKKGSKLTQILKLAGRKFHVRWTVVENAPCERVVWEGLDGKSYVVRDVPPELFEKVRQAREQLLEACADVDPVLFETLIEGRELIAPIGGLRS